MESVASSLPRLLLVRHRQTEGELSSPMPHRCQTAVVLIADVADSVRSPRLASSRRR